MQHSSFHAVFLAVFVLTGITACRLENHNYLVTGLQSNREEQRSLIRLLENSSLDTETRFAVMNQIAENLRSENQHNHLIYFLTTSVESNPSDPYNAYWLLMVASAYLDNNAPRIAEYYFERILATYPDLTIGDSSVHRMCLEHLTRISTNHEVLIQHYTDLITRFSTKINLPRTYFLLAHSYERLGEWELAIKTYAQFLEYGRYDIIIPGVPDAWGYAKRLVDFNASAKNWTFETLDELVAAIKNAIDSNNHWALERYRADVNFFAMSWKQDASDSNSQVYFNMRDFMGGNRIRYNENLHASSSPNEAFLRTFGWNQFVSTWYLYFRKVNFPADPKIHGRWEWAGIYFGEKL